ncbi:glycerophosphodiester phosphodiesterase family protein [Corynebacterium uterequi]|uniref:Glycerophosphoryl diester phosphodiesterase n=1 Tax=Corynebacterium uterequi TaxID=1072256 RepID=A0A0G3HJ61_9CORY|nr:glycerophosphodiester phosphodiesterase family protein [Corynebacterium uterequi]AKK11993.1 glycerophosphoryl diester phosphodiesterase [Corynebacterium uterequi]
MKSLPHAFDLQAHRFGRGQWTEESAAGIAGSLALNVTTLELDIVLAADGTPVVWHDPTVQADKCVDTAPATDGDPAFPYVGKYLHELSFDQLRTLNCNVALDAFPDADHAEVNRMLQLSDVFELTKDHPDVFFNIETKREFDNPEHTASPQEFVDAILDVVRRYDKADRVMIQSFDYSTFPLVAAAAPEIPLLMLTWGEFDPDAAYLGNLKATSFFDAADQLGVSIISPNYLDIADPASYIARTHVQGLRVTPYTINDEADMAAWVDAGVDGIITDYPARLAALLDARGIAY